MTQFTNGLDALNALTATNEGGGSGSEFTQLKAGMTFNVKVIDPKAVQMAYGYGIYKKVNSFVAKNPSTKSKNGYPVENLTPWDKAWKYHKDKSEVYTDAHGVEAGKYRAKQRFAMAFFGLAEGAPIIVDLSKNQAQGVAAAITKYASKLGKLAFELSKDADGKVTFSPILDMDEDLTEKEQANFAAAPTEFPADLFDGIWYEQDEAQMVELLKQAGFDVSLIGYEEKPNKPIEGDFTPSDKPLDVEEDDLPF